MRELTFLGTRKIAWRTVREPELGGPHEALVRPFIAARCDGDVVPIFHGLVGAMGAGVALHFLDPVTTEMLGARPYAAPFALGHECIAEVVACGELVQNTRPGQIVIVPWAISCGSCHRCLAGFTSKCAEAGESVLSGYGFGPAMGPWGGAVSDLVRVPYADAMLVQVPPDVDPLKLASASDNMPDAWRTVGPHLAKNPEAPVLVVGGGARSIGLFAAGMAVALGSSRVDYLDDDRERLEIAASLGANAVERGSGNGWFKRHAPRVHGVFPITVEASSTGAGLRYALRSLSPGGTCTAVGFYFARETGLPLMQMYANSTTLEIGVSHARANLQNVIDLVQQGQFDPRKVATVVADWDDAPEAFMTRTTKVVVRRPSEISGLPGRQSGSRQAPLPPMR